MGSSSSRPRPRKRRRVGAGRLPPLASRRPSREVSQSVLTVEGRIQSAGAFADGFAHLPRRRKLLALLLFVGPFAAIALLLLISAVL